MKAIKFQPGYHQEFLKSEQPDAIKIKGKGPRVASATEGGGGAARYLEACSYSVDLGNIYNVHSTCAYNEQMEFTPVQVEVHPQA